MWKSLCQRDDINFCIEIPFGLEGIYTRSPDSLPGNLCSIRASIIILGRQIPAIWKQIEMWDKDMIGCGDTPGRSVKAWEGIYCFESLECGKGSYVCCSMCYWPALASVLGSFGLIKLCYATCFANKREPYLQRRTILLVLVFSWCLKKCGSCAQGLIINRFEIMLLWTVTSSNVK